MLNAPIVSNGKIVEVRQLNRRFVVLSVCLALLLTNLPYWLPAFQFIPAQGTMNRAMQFFGVYNEYFLHGGLPRWMPYKVYGSPGDDTLLETLTPAVCFVAFAGRLLGIADALLLFKIAVSLEQLTVLIGMALVSRRVFSDRTTRLFVCLGAIVLSGLWGIQLDWNLRIFYLLPLIVFCLLKFDETADVKFAAIAGILGILSCWGNIPSRSFLLFVYLLFSGMLLLPRLKQIGSRVRIGSNITSLLWMVIFLVMLIMFWEYVRHRFDGLVVYAPSPQGALARHMSLRLSLTDDPIFNPGNFLELLYAIPVHEQITLYIGLLPLVFMVYALFTAAFDHVFRAILGTIVLIGLGSIASFTFLAPVISWLLPFFEDFRYLSFTRVLIKVFLLLVAGLGLDRYITAGRQHQAEQWLIVWISGGFVAGILALDVFAFQGKIPYASFLQNPSQPLEQFHYVAVGVLVIFGMLLYWSIRYGIGNMRIILIGCFCFEMLSYQYFWFLVSPVRLNPLAGEAYETVERYQQRVEGVAASFNALQYEFQRERMFPQQTARLIESVFPMITRYVGIKTQQSYSVAYVDPCFQDFPIDYLPVGIDRFVKARLGIPLDTPLVGNPPLPNDLSNDPVFLRAMGCQAPKLFLTSQVHIAQSLREAAALLKTSQDFDVIPVLLSEKGQELPIFPRTTPQVDPSGTVTVTRFTANSLQAQAQVSSPGGAWLIYLDAYHPGWTVTVDGSPRPMMTANLAFKAVQLESGLHEVQFTFTGDRVNRFSIQVMFVIGIISILALLGITWDLAMPGLIPKRRETP
jgi:hypothetical protein